MEFIKRQIDLIERESAEVDRFGINSKGTLSIILKNVDSYERIINLNGIELTKLKNFLERWD